MPIVKLNRIRDYRADLMFLRHLDTANVINSDNFAVIRSFLRFYLEYNNYIASADPLWYSSIMMEHFAARCATVAVHTGVMSFDENMIRCKGRTSAPG